MDLVTVEIFAKQRPTLNISLDAGIGDKVTILAGCQEIGNKARDTGLPVKDRSTEFLPDRTPTPTLVTTKAKLLA